MCDSMELLKNVVAAKGQAATARELGYSPSAINQALKGKYGGSLDNLLCRVAETYGTGTVFCPVLGEIRLKRCARERKINRAFNASSPQRVRLWRECRKCPAVERR